MQLERIEMVNDHPTLTSALADLIRQRAREAGWLA